MMRASFLFLTAVGGANAFSSSFHASSSSSSSSFSSSSPAAAASRRAAKRTLRMGVPTDKPFANPDHDLLVRVAKGEVGERTPVWLMRQAGRYMADFRKYSDKYGFRLRSETPEIAIELSLQCWRAYGMDGVIMFSDILTPLPAMGVEFDVIKGKGPVIADPLRTEEQIAALTKLEDPGEQLPFVGETLRSLRKETEGRCSLLGFVGAPLTLAAYSVNGAANKHCFETKKMMTHRPDLLHKLLDHYATAIGTYACHQVEQGAQVIQYFESWAHHLSPAQFEEFAKPYANKAMRILREK